MLTDTGLFSLKKIGMESRLAIFMPYLQALLSFIDYDSRGHEVGISSIIWKKCVLRYNKLP